MDKFKKVPNGFNYVYEKLIPAGETVIVKMPPVSSNKRGINDIGWIADGDITLYGTLSSNPANTQLWQEIQGSDEVNKTVTAIKAVNFGDFDATVVIRVILN